MEWQGCLTLAVVLLTLCAMVKELAGPGFFELAPVGIPVAIAGCCAFASPVTYQTHLIVYGPGGYRFTDFVRVGLPLNAVCATIAVVLIPFIWPF